MLDFTVEVYGLNETLRALRDMPDDVRKQAYAKIRSATSGLVKTAGQGYPRMKPLRNWREGGRLGWRTSAVVRGVQAQVGGRQPRGADSFALVTLVNRNAAAGLFDIAGNAGGSRAKSGPRNRSSQASPPFHQLLQQYGRPAGRGIGKQLPHLREASYQALVEALQEVSAMMGRKLGQVK